MLGSIKLSLQEYNEHPQEMAQARKPRSAFCPSNMESVTKEYDTHGNRKKQFGEVRMHRPL